MNSGHLPFTLSLLLLILETLAIPVKPGSFLESRSICVPSGVPNSWIPLAPFQNTGNNINVLFCNPGEPIPSLEAFGALFRAMTTIEPHINIEPHAIVPGGSFQKSTIFRETGDRVTIFLHTVGNQRITWQETGLVITELEGYMSGAGGAQHFNELEFRVRDHEQKVIAVGRIQLVREEAVSATL